MQLRMLLGPQCSPVLRGCDLLLSPGRRTGDRSGIWRRPHAHHRPSLRHGEHERGSRDGNVLTGPWPRIVRGHRLLHKVCCLEHWHGGEDGTGLWQLGPGIGRARTGHGPDGLWSDARRCWDAVRWPSLGVQLALADAQSLICTCTPE